MNRQQNGEKRHVEFTGEEFREQLYLRCEVSSWALLEVYELFLDEEDTDMDMSSPWRADRAR